MQHAEPGLSRPQLSLALRLVLLASAAIVANSAYAPTGAPAAQIATPAAVIPEPAAGWSATDLRALVHAARGAGAEGLNPDDYLSDDLVTAAEQGRVGAATDALAERAVLSLAHDFAAGHVTNRRAFDWHIASSAPDETDLAAAMQAARQGGRLEPWLRSLLPQSAAYGALRAALAATDDAARRDRIRANMERWRWLPRDFAAGSYVYVNIPTYKVRLIEDGAEQASYVAVVGAPDTPTPALAATASAVVVNPWWYVPASLIDKGEVRGGARSAQRGFVFKTSADGTLLARQKPGPENALGRIKIEMPNAHAIYMHDTPARGVFASARRARSHGCVRVQDIEDLAARLSGDGGRVQDALADSDTHTLRLERRWPVYLVYFTIDADASGALKDYPDIYDRDAALAARLDGRRAPPAEPTLAAVPARRSDRPVALAAAEREPVATPGVEPVDLSAAAPAAADSTRDGEDGPVSGEARTGQ